MPTKVVDTKQLEEQWLGKLVEILDNPTFSMGRAKPGDLGVVSKVYENTLMLRLLPTKDNKEELHNWRCYPENVKLCTGDIVETQKVKGYMQFYHGLVDYYNNTRVEQLNKIRELEREILHYRQLAQANAILTRSFISKHAALDTDRISAGFKALESCYESISYVNDVILAKTKPVVMRWIDDNDEAITVKMGVYEVCVHTDSIVTFKHLGGGEHAQIFNTYIHPHIPRAGDPCWGTWASSIEQKAEANDYLGILQLAYDYLCTCDKDGWYINGMAFHKDSSRLCHRCWLHRDECECDLCSHCGHPMDNCECDRCADTNEYIHDRSEYCEGCRSWNASEGICEY